LASHRVIGADTERNFVHGAFAHNYSTSPFELRDHSRIPVGDMILEEQRTRGRSHAGGVEGILDDHRHAMEEAKPASFGFGPVVRRGLHASSVLGNGHQRIDAALPGVDGSKTGFNARRSPWTSRIDAHSRHPSFAIARFVQILGLTGEGRQGEVSWTSIVSMAPVCQTLLRLQPTARSRWDSASARPFWWSTIRRVSQTLPARWASPRESIPLETAPRLCSDTADDAAFQSRPAIRPITLHKTCRCGRWPPSAMASSKVHMRQRWTI